MIRLEIRDATGTWMLDIDKNERFFLYYQEVSVVEKKWRCLVANGKTTDTKIEFCKEHAHLLPKEIFKSLRVLLGTMVNLPETGNNPNDSH